ncbi:helix-turn-helix domain-containing protein [Photobacterium kishitanii]|uniref:helix-turn-helix domain-containing protein n=1 Tax=Photobacterium kishitanii TaxID=318456 RepID=UPI002738A93B|nr:helix-turn-helix transcriptional regulator [Photobacterium kishitanii]
MDRVEIGIQIRTYRKKLGLTQKQLYEKTHVHKNTISEMENGRFSGSFDLFEKVLDAIGLAFVVTAKTNMHEIHDLPTGSIERFVEGSWVLSILRFHVEASKITPTIKRQIDNHNNTRNISVLEFDLNTLVHTYRTDVSLNGALKKKRIWCGFGFITAKRSSIAILQAG